MGPRYAALTVCLSFLLSAATASKTRFPSFYSLALAAGTDKVTVHSYHHLYDRHLPAYRHVPTRFLEIGLGCMMDYGPGRSMNVWYQYFTHYNATIDFLEVDGACTEKFKHLSTRGKMIVGDQANAENLLPVVERAREIGGYDIIVDDGGHHMKQQLLSFDKLWPVVNPGGMYVVEDLHSSYSEGYGGGPIGKNGTFIAFMKHAIDLLNCKKQTEATDCIDGLRSLECYEDICMFSKAPSD